MSDDRISRSLHTLLADPLRPEIWDCVIVGSGYGGAMAAAELSALEVRREAGHWEPLRVLVLERGREFLAGEFPERLAELPGELRWTRNGEQGGQGEGLLDLRVGDDMNLLLANGLGGGSLINAGVMLKPDPTQLPAGLLRSRLQQLLQTGVFDQASRLLGARPSWQPGQPELDKTKALREVFPQARPVPITISDKGGANSADVMLKACTRCGNCMTGCNAGAKDSLDLNLLRRAKAQGADLVCGASVVKLRRGQGLWDLDLRHSDAALARREPKLPVLRAHHVVLAAGSLGSTEILLRSRSARLPLPLRLGSGFSGNGDNLAALAGLRQAANARGDESVDGGQPQAVGPTISASAALRLADGRQVQVQEFSVPGALRRLFDEICTTAELLRRLPEGDREVHGREPADRLDPAAVDEQAMRHALVVGLIGHDEADGHLSLPGVRADRQSLPVGCLQVVWPGARKSALIDEANRLAAQRAEAAGVRWLNNPGWRPLPDKLQALFSTPRGPLLSVHPLGGCGIGDSWRDGVVDASGKVWQPPADTPYGASSEVDGDAQERWEGSLLVLDGAMLNASLGVNPALSIAALALQGTRDWIAEMSAGPQPSWRRAPAVVPVPRERPLAPPRPHPRPPLRATEVALLERLSGEVWMQGPEGLQPMVVELTLAMQPLPLLQLMQRLQRGMNVLPERSRLRLFRAADWTKQGLEQAEDCVRERWAIAQAPLSGSLSLLHREPSTLWQRRLRSLWPWALNRGFRDIWQKLGSAEGLAGDWAGYLKDLLKLASKAGEVRRFDYRLRIGAPTLLPLGDRRFAADFSDAWLEGEKRLTYGRRANPWQQLARMRLTRMPRLAPPLPFVAPPLLRLEPRFLIASDQPLLRISAQGNQVDALAELLSFAAYLLRLLIDIHLWTFRKSDAGPLPEPQRLPGVVDGIAPEITELVVERLRDVEPVKVRLSHYRPPQAQAGLPPLVFIHGYSVSGNTFTHPSLAPSAVGYFLRRGREVWVLDLRSSSGMPTATQPWPMEQVALVDLPAALLHIRQQAGRPLDVVAHCIGCAMLSMALLTRAADVHSGRIQLGEASWLSAVHLGRLAAFNAIRQGEPGAVIRRLVLSQKGPVLRYTAANQLRAYLMQSLRRLLLPADYQFRPPHPPGLADEMLDRLLASLPYPPDEYDRENPLRPCARTPWVASRHRMDMLYGRDFEAAQLSDATLMAIDDLFGPMHLDTVAQTIHFSRFDAITSQHGRGEFVTQGRLRAYWGGLPTLSLHGELNGLVSPHTQQLTDLALGTAGVPHRSELLLGMGHQDVFIGRRAEQVFGLIDDFLRGPPPPVLSQLPPPLLPVSGSELGDWVVCEPWIGPRLGLRDSSRAPGTLREPSVFAMGRPDYGQGQLVLVDRRSGTVSSGLPLPAGEWLSAVLPNGSPDVLVLIAYEAQHVPTRALRSVQAQQAIGQWSGGEVVARAASWKLAARNWLRLGALRAEQFTVTAAAQAHWWHDQQALEPGAGWRFALASCQYPAGLLDAELAGASLQSLAAWAQRADGPRLGLLVGDQIYADATAGLLDPVRRDERYDRPYERAFRLPAMRAVLRHLPCAMLGDDHELIDNDEPLGLRPWDVEQQRRIALRREGRIAYRIYQRLQRRDQMQTNKTPGPLDWSFRFGSFDFYLLDTRAGRQARTRPGMAAQIVSDDQRDAFEHWLTRSSAERPRFVVCPSLLLPRRRQTADDDGAAPRSDAWDGYPASLDWLFQLMLRLQARNLVFLSGDEHHSLTAEIEIEIGRADARLKTVCVHASGLYAPLPFANGQPSDLQGQDRFTTRGGVAVSLHSDFLPPGDGFMLIEPRQLAHGDWLLELELHQAPGVVRRQLNLS